MDYSVLEISTLFQGVPAKDLRVYLEETPHHIQCYDNPGSVLSWKAVQRLKKPSQTAAR